jgi:hypothetical protein
LLIRIPGDRHRHVIVGATGSGKTQYALWELSHRNFHINPWIIYNWKRDESIDSIPGARELELDEIPESPGVYIVHPLPRDERAVEDQMWAIWERGHCGVYIDEGYMAGDHNEALRALLTQGRSKEIPLIVLSQRPVWLERFIFTESEFRQMFRLGDTEDVKTMKRYIPEFPRNVPDGVDLSQRLPDYFSYYYDVGRDTLHITRPIPHIEVIHATFARRFASRIRA